MFFTFEKIDRMLKDIEQYIYSARQEIKNWKIKYGEFKGGEKQELDAADWEVFTCGDFWGGRNLHLWFRTNVKISESFKDKTVVFSIRTGVEGEFDALNPQFMVYVDGEFIQGMDINHREVILEENTVTGNEHCIALYAYSGMQDRKVRLVPSMQILNAEVEKLYYDIKVPFEVARNLDKQDKRRIDILNYLNEAINMLDFRAPFSERFNNSIKVADDFLENEFYGKFCGMSDVVASCVGHTHIDVAWLWTLSQTREKVGRSFSTVLKLMERYPEYTFMSSQPQLYKYIKEDHPEIYEKIKQRISEGRWEAEGAMWLEADCNVTSGESLVRQILFGTRFFEKEFGIKNKILWLPDVFGYSAALPQIMKKSGIEYFMTTKISWNQYNKVPCDTFMWRGMDGTEILTHFITTSDPAFTLNSYITTYNGNLVPTQIMGAWQRYQQKDISNNVLVSFGYGDGGGGPTKEMLENARRMDKGIPGCPRVKIEKAGDFFERLKYNISENKRLPKWVGELYLEYHRGTYTSMARNKKFNRKSEFLYQDIELFSTINMMLNQQDYPAQKINEGWESILLNQFHDILPGSSIKEVYEESGEQYRQIIDNGKNILDGAFKNIAGNIQLEYDSIVVFNQLSFTRGGMVEVELTNEMEGLDVFEYDGSSIDSQVVEKGGKRYLVFFAENVSAKGYKCFKAVPDSKRHDNTLKSGADEMYIGKKPLKDLRVETHRLENRYMRIILDENGNIASLYDKENKREVLRQGQKGNVLQAFEDKPLQNDAWDIDIFYMEKMWEINEVLTAEVVENGPVRGCLRIKRKFMDSLIEQDIVIYNDVPRIDFISRIDWKEKYILLKAAFPVDVNANSATYDIQYGNVQRDTHWNTSWDTARFEVCAHKWADLSEGGYGVSLLNDCKYGHDIKDGVMRLTLLKSAVFPNEDADREHHEFTYSIYPHCNSWKDAETVNQAYDLNCPLYGRFEKTHSGKLPFKFSFISADVDNVIIEVVKKAEDNNDIILRLYEYKNKRSDVKAITHKDIMSVCECTLLEENTAEISHDKNTFQFSIKPYEIKTYRLRF